MRGKVLSTVKGADGVLSGVILLDKGNRIERPPSFKQFALWRLGAE